jgi:hypothetical protein
LAMLEQFDAVGVIGWFTSDGPDHRTYLHLLVGNVVSLSLLTYEWLWTMIIFPVRAGVYFFPLSAHQCPAFGPILRPTSCRPPESCLLLRNHTQLDLITGLDQDAASII